MINKLINSVGLVSLAMSMTLLTACSSNTTAEAQKNNTRLKTEIIKQEGDYGTIQEERVKAMSSEARFIPRGQKEGYTLIDPSLADAKENAHRDPKNPVIGSFVIGKW